MDDRRDFPSILCEGSFTFGTSALGAGMADGVTDAEDRTAAPLGHIGVPPTRNQASLLRTNNNKDCSACSIPLFLPRFPSLK